MYLIIPVHYTILYWTPPNSNTLHPIAWHFTELHYTTLHSMLLYCTVLHYAVLQYTTLHSTVFKKNWTLLPCISLHCNSLIYAAHHFISTALYYAKSATALASTPTSTDLHYTLQPVLMHCIIHQFLLHCTALHHTEQLLNCSPSTVHLVW